MGRGVTGESLGPAEYPMIDRQDFEGGFHAGDQSLRSRLWAAALARSRQQEEFLTDFGMVRADRTKNCALHARHRCAAPPPRHRAGRAALCRDRGPCRRHGRPRAGRAGPGRLQDRGHRRARRRQAGAPDRPRRLSGRSRSRHADARSDPGAAARRSIRARTNTGARANCSGSIPAPRTSSGSAISS